MAFVIRQGFPSHLEIYIQSAVQPLQGMSGFTALAFSGVDALEDINSLLFITLIGAIMHIALRNFIGND